MEARFYTIWITELIFSVSLPPFFCGGRKCLHYLQNDFASNEIDGLKWKLSPLLCNNDKQEVVLREKRDRSDYKQIAALASKMGLYR